MQGQDDGEADSDVTYPIVTTNITVVAAEYVGIDPPDISVTNINTQSTPVETYTSTDGRAQEYP